MRLDRTNDRKHIHEQQKWKDKSIKEFTKVANKYETDDAGIYKLCRKDYPNPQAFFDGVKRCLRKDGRLVIRDFSSNNPLVLFFMNHIELSFCNLFGHGDVEIVTIKMIERCSKNSGLTVEKAEIRKR